MIYKKSLSFLAGGALLLLAALDRDEIGRASCRERVLLGV